jgi:Zn-dependent peptidase ImmA (M78 family)
MAFKRGFKSQCERRSVEIRKDLGLDKVAPLDAFELSQHMGTTVWSTSDIEGMSSTDIASLTKFDQDSWSALTLRMGTDHLIVYKDISSAPRINSVVMHELSHIMLGHELAEACILEDGSLIPSSFDPDQEDEANWLGGTLLLPRPALLAIRRRGMSDQEAIQYYTVSQEMLTWRIRMTGVDYQVSRSKSY